MTGATKRGHLSLIVSQERTNPVRLRAEYLRYHAACLDMLHRTDDARDRAWLRGMARLWLMLADRATLRFGVLLTALVAMSGIAPADPSGMWREKDGDLIRVYRCGSGYCAAIARVNPPLETATGKPRTDKDNPDPRKQGRTLVGTQILWSTRPNGPGKWSGKLYDVDRGMTLSGNLVEVDTRTIRIEGCMMGICGGETLDRVSN